MGRRSRKKVVLPEVGAHVALRSSRGTRPSELVVARVVYTEQDAVVVRQFGMDGHRSWLQVWDPEDVVTSGTYLEVEKTTRRWTDIVRELQAAADEAQGAAELKKSIVWDRIDELMTGGE